MTQTLYAHMNKREKFKKKLNDLKAKKKKTGRWSQSPCRGVMELRHGREE
jgi:hypothetical protein